MTDKNKCLRKLHKEDTKKAILNAAYDEFFQHGYNGGTLSKIAEKAGISKAAIYLYYKNKDDLFMSLMEKQLDSYFSKTSELLIHNKNPKEALKEIMIQLMTPTDQDSFQMQSLIQKTTLPNKLKDRIFSTYKDKFMNIYKLLERVLKLLKDEGELPDTNFHELTYILIGVFFSVTHRTNMFGEIFDANYADFVIDVFLNGAKNAAPYNGGTND